VADCTRQRNAPGERLSPGERASSASLTLRDAASFLATRRCRASSTGTIPGSAPIAGVYVVDANVCFSFGAAGDRNLEIKQNGTTVSLLQQPTNATSPRDTCIHDSAQLKLNAGDYVELFPFVDEGPGVVVASTLSTPQLAATWIAPG
jgi:hypothetical protein